jgi:hypothetical protein
VIPKFTKKWAVEWKGKRIVVENWWDLLLRSGERMIVDGEIVAENQAWGARSSNLEADIDDIGFTRKLRAHIGGVDFGLRIGCVIFIDDEIVGGDTEKRFVT